jgi:signal transduction histidine kinase
MLAKVFRPFHTTKPEGNGLGLPTARKVILAHGGAIDVQSESERGTKVAIRLPALPDQANSSPSNAAQKPNAAIV